MTNWAATQNDVVFTCQVIVKPAWISMGNLEDKSIRAFGGAI